MALFQTGNFRLASGAESRWKIECDALTPDDWRGLAAMIAERARGFSHVAGVPRGGLPLAEALRHHVSATGPRLLVDDVWTTGGSIAKFRQPGDVCWVVFARRPPTDGTRALFTMDQG